MDSEHGSVVLDMFAAAALIGIAACPTRYMWLIENSGHICLDKMADMCYAIAWQMYRAKMQTPVPIGDTREATRPSH